MKFVHHAVFSALHVGLTWFNLQCTHTRKGASSRPRARSTSSSSRDSIGPPAPVAPDPAPEAEVRSDQLAASNSTGVAGEGFRDDSLCDAVVLADDPHAKRRRLIGHPCVAGRHSVSSAFKPYHRTTCAAHPDHYPPSGPQCSPLLARTITARRLIFTGSSNCVKHGCVHIPQVSSFGQLVRFVVLTFVGFAACGQNFDECQVASCGGQRRPGAPPGLHYIL